MISIFLCTTEILLLQRVPILAEDIEEQEREG